MNEFLKDRILRRLEPLSDERLYQVLDYIEFLESKYAQHEAAPPVIAHTRGEGAVESTRRVDYIPSWDHRPDRSPPGPHRRKPAAVLRACRSTVPSHASG